MRTGPLHSSRFFGRLASLVLLAALFSGCGDEPDRAELDLLLNEDPVFHELVRTKINLETQIATLRAALASHRTETDEKIRQLKAEHDAQRQTKEKSISDYRALLNGQRRDFETAYNNAREQLEARKRMRADIEKAIREAKGVLAKKDKLAIPGREIGEWEERITNLQNRLPALDAEISTLEASVSLRKKKLKYL